MIDPDAPPPRRVTVVVAEPPGVAGPFEVAVPWWQEAKPVVEVAEAQLGVSVTIVRLLDSEGPFPGGAVTYLVEAPDVDPGLLRPIDDRTASLLRSDPNRAPYAEVGGPTELLEWADDALASVGIERTGRPEQIRTWNLAGIWRLHTSAGRAWVKATPHFLDHEPAVLAHLQGSGLIPELIAGERGRSLMLESPGVDGYEADEPTLRSAIDVLLDVQAAVDLDALPDVPRLDERRFTDQLLVVAGDHRHGLTAAERSSLDRLIESLPDRFAAAAPFGPSLVHGDVHGGNLRLREGHRPVLLDWGDSFVGCALFDVFAPESYSMPGAERLTQHWLDRLSDRHDSDAHAAWTAFRPVAALGLALVYHRFCANIEASELPYHRDDVLPALRAGLAATQAPPT